MRSNKGDLERHRKENIEEKNCGENLFKKKKKKKTKFSYKILIQKDSQSRTSRNSLQNVCAGAFLYVFDSLSAHDVCL